MFNSSNIIWRTNLKFIILQISGYTYRRDTFIDGESLESFKTLKEASTYCSSHSNCGGIMDDLCHYPNVIKRKYVAYDVWKLNRRCGSLCMGGGTGYACTWVMILYFWILIVMLKDNKLCVISHVTISLQYHVKWNFQI